MGAPFNPITHVLEKTLSAVYLVALVGVGALILWVLVDAVMSVSRKPQWENQVMRRLSVVPTTDRRRQNLPFVGVERRKSADPVTVEGDRQAA